MPAIKVKTTGGKTVQIERDEIVTAALEIISAIYSQHHSVIIWGNKTTDRYAIVPFNSKIHNDEN
jgi:hypothetical protein